MKRSGWFALLSIVAFSVLISTIPLYRYTLWGLDSGEYLYYTHRWVETGGAYLSVDGWGSAYPFFPGMFILGGGFHLLSGVDLIRSVVFVPVILSALSPILVFLIVRKVMDDWRPGILSAFLFSSLPPLIYGYSQPRPETVGFFFMLLILSFTITSLKENPKTVLPIFVVLIPLVITHHFSTYFLILLFLGGIFTSRIWRRKERSIDLFKTRLLILFMITTFIYWISYAVPFGESRIKNALIFPSYTVLAVPFLLLLFFEFLVRIRRKFDFVVPINFHKEGIRSFMIFFSIALIITMSIMINVALGTLPVRQIELGFTVFLYIPMVILSLFAMSARKIIKSVEEGPTLLGWLSFVIISIIIGVIFDSHSLLPMRQFTFLLLIVTLIFGIGLFHFERTIYNPTDKMKKTFALGVLIILLTAFLIPLSYPSQERAGGFTEGIESEDMEAAFWAKTSTEKRIATDHRMSNALISVSYQNQTWRDGFDMYFSDDPESALEDIKENNVTYILWDEEMRKGAIIELGRNPRPLSPELIEYYQENFYLVYRSEEVVIYAVP